MAKLSKKDVSSLSKLPQYNNRTIDMTPDLDFSQVVLYDESSYKTYKRIAVGIGDLFESQGLVEVKSYVYNIKLYGRVIHHQINVMGRDPKTGQPHSAYLM